MWGQWCEPFAPPPEPFCWPCDGPVSGRLPAPGVVCVVVLGDVVVEPDEVAALANAAPPPASAPVTTTVTSVRLMR